MDFDTAVKMNIYETIARTTQAPTSADVAKALSTSPEEVEAALERLLVPEPGDPSRIRMAPPFSGVETPFRVQVQDKLYYANCVWDAPGIAAALQADAISEASDGQSGEPMMLEVRNGQPAPEECVIHFAVPAAQWCEARGLPKRPCLTLNQLWYLAMTWSRRDGRDFCTGWFERAILGSKADQWRSAT